MQTAEQLQRVTNGNNPKLSGYQLLTLLSRNMGRLKLKQAEALTFMALASYWNGQPIYPKIQTLCENTNLCDKAVRNAIKSLIEQGYLLKSKRGKNANVYSIVVSKVLATVESGIKDRTRAVLNTAPCNMKSDHEKLDQQHEENLSEQKPDKNVVSFPNFSLKSIPASILAKKTDKNGRPIRSHAAYWNSFTDEQKREYLRNEALEAEKARKKAERAKQAELEKQRLKEEEKKRQEELNKPLNEQWTRAQAIKHIWHLRNMRPLLNKKNSLPAQLASIYNLDIEGICAMAANEIESIK